jgi:hypothetical protein
VGKGAPPNPDAKAQGTLSLGDREVPTEAIVKALQEHFITKRTSALVKKLADQVVKSAAAKVIDEEEAEP